jgi:hypothetical protein
MDAALSEDSDAVAALDYPDDMPAALCPSCGELLAWHDVSCSSAAGSQPSTLAKCQVENDLAHTSSGFVFGLGQAVQPAPEAPASPVVWRGQVKERHPRTGLVHRINVYHLDNGYWDCYYEAELVAT